MNVIEINTDHMQPLEAGASLYTNRTYMVQMQKERRPEVTISIQGYNRLEKTRRCVESVLKYTQGIDYELLLIDNGSTDGTLEYFKSIPFENKRILHITKNIGTGFPLLTLTLNDFGDYFCNLANDIIVTKDWMYNLLTCAKSDSKIGMVNPLSNNVSSQQEVDFCYKDYDEMQQMAGEFNRSDPKKWEDRQRLITLGTLWKKEALMAVGWPIWDLGFFHDFSDDDITFRIRRMGYRTVLAGDTWICHDHKVGQGEGKEPLQFQRSLEIGRENFRKKYFGVDAWEDVNNYLIPYMKYFPAPKSAGMKRILGIDVRCGTPILDIKNWLRKSGIFSTELSAFTQDVKYWTDLKTICTGTVVCDREEFLQDSFLENYFDYVIADRPINCYHEPQKLLNDVFRLCKSGGTVVFRMKNTMSFQEYINMLGQRDVYDRTFAYNIPVEAVVEAVSKVGTLKNVIFIPFAMDQEEEDSLGALIPDGFAQEQYQQILERLLHKEYLIIVEKT